MSANRVIGVDLGGTKILAGIVERDGTVLERREHPTPLESADALVDGLTTAVRELLDESIAAVGFGVPGPLDLPAGRVGQTPNIPLSGYPLRDEMRARFGIPVGIDNDANAAALAEWIAGAGRGTRNLVMLTLGTGVGGGVVVDSRVLRGPQGAAAELGHIVLVHDGPPCQGACTGHGHLEAFCSGLAAGHAAREVFGPAADAHRLVRLANEGDARAIELLTRIGDLLGSALGTLTSVFNPEMIIVGGGFGTAAGELLLVPARERLLREVLAPARDFVRVVSAQLGTAAGLIGAGLVAFEALDAV